MAIVQREPAQLHDELAAAGIPVRTVRYYSAGKPGGERYEVVLADGATAEQQAQADAAAAAHLARDYTREEMRQRRRARLARDPERLLRALLDPAELDALRAELA